jgi:hypothetical protein
MTALPPSDVTLEGRGQRWWDLGRSGGGRGEDEVLRCGPEQVLVLAWVLGCLGEGGQARPGIASCLPCLGSAFRHCDEFVLSGFQWHRSNNWGRPAKIRSLRSLSLFPAQDRASNLPLSACVFSSKRPVPDQASLSPFLTTNDYAVCVEAASTLLIGAPSRPSGLSS